MESPSAFGNFGVTNQVRGPRSIVLGLDHLVRLRTNQLDFYQEMHNRYGDTVPVRLGPYTSWLLFHPGHIEAVLKTNASKFVRFEPIMKILAQWNGESLLISEGSRWQARRRQVLPALATGRLYSYGDKVTRMTLDMCERWQSGAEAGFISVVTDREMTALTLSIAASTLFNETLGSDAPEIGSAVATLSDVAFRESTNPFRFPDWLPIPGKREKRLAISTVSTLVQRIVENRLSKNRSDQGDVLSTLIEYLGEDANAIRNEVMTLLIAGHETSGATLSWASVLLANHPKELARAQSEIDHIARDRPLQVDDVKDLEVLRAVIDETLRLYPPAYTLFPRRAVETVSIGETTIEKGQLAQIVPYVTHRDARWFEQPLAFLPSRFINQKTWPRYSYLPFGAGPRVCIGQGFALTELALVLGSLLQRFSPLPSTLEIGMSAKFSLRPIASLQQNWRLRTE